MRPTFRGRIGVLAFTIGLSLAIGTGSAEAHDGGHGGRRFHSGVFYTGFSSADRANWRTPMIGSMMPSWYLNTNPTPIVADDLPAARLHRYLGHVFGRIHGARTGS